MIPHPNLLGWAAVGGKEPLVFSLQKGVELRGQLSGVPGLFIQTPGTLALNNCCYSWISTLCLSSKIEDLSVLLPSQFILVSHTFIEYLLGSRHWVRC